MDFLGIGVPELVVILVLMVIFIGPKDLPKMAGKFAKFLRDLRMMTEGLTSEWQRETNIMDGLNLESLKELRDEIDATKKTIQSAGSDIIGLNELDKPKNTVAKNNISTEKSVPTPKKPTEENITGDTAQPE